MAGRLGMMLETSQLEDWKRDGRLSSWKIGDNTGDLTAGRLEMRQDT